MRLDAGIGLLLVIHLHLLHTGHSWLIGGTPSILSAERGAFGCFGSCFGERQKLDERRRRLWGRGGASPPRASGASRLASLSLSGLPPASIVYDDRHVQHNLGGHPEKSERASAAWLALKDSGLADQCLLVDGREATDEELLRVHSADHVREVTEGTATMDPSTYFNPDASPQAARVAAGCVCAMAEKVMEGSARNGMCIVRPPGHHAPRNTAMGFCIFNSVAAAAAKARAMGAERVLVFDWDVHHGNGIQDIFYDDPSVLYISAHRGGIDESYFFPGTGTLDRLGKGKGRGFTVNIPMENGMGFTGDAAYDLLMEWIVSPIAREFKPDMVLVSAGFDAADGDPLGGFYLSPGVFARMTKSMMEAAPDGKILLALEGGYNVPVTADCVTECTKVLMGGDPPPQQLAGPHEDVTELDVSNLRRIADRLREFWPCIPESAPSRAA